MQSNWMSASDRLPIIAQSVVLRCFVPEDASRVFEMSREHGIRAWLPDQVYDNEEHALEVLHYLIEKHHDPGDPSLAPYVLGVCLRDSGELVGHVGLSPLDGQVEIGFAVADPHKGKGLATEAARAMSEWGLARFGLPTILGIAAADNSASCKVLERAGFELLDEESGTLHGQTRLVRTYQKTPSETDPGGPDTER